MNKKTFLLVALACTSVCASGQHIFTKNEVIDLGNILFQSPSVATFELQNSGADPLVIRQVHTSCGCTTVDYPKHSIAPGATFTVAATYDAAQLGRFFKDIALYTNASEQPFYLTIRGAVVEELVGYAGSYPFSIEDVSAERVNVEFDDVNSGEFPVQKIHVKNNGTRALNPTVMHVPEYLMAFVSPSTIMPGREGVVTFTLDSRKLRDYGLTQTSVYLGMFPGDKVSPAKEISVSAVLLPAFKELTENDLAKAPQMKISQENIEMKLRGPRKKAETILIENVGKSTLEISNLQMFTTGLRVKLSKSRIEPGDKASLKVTADAELLHSARSKPRVLMITNDPMKSKVVVNIDVK